MKFKIFHFIPVTYSVDSGRTKKTEMHVSPNYDSEILLLKCCSKPKISLTLIKLGQSNAFLLLSGCKLYLKQSVR